MKVIIDSEKVETRTGEGARGRWEIRTQAAWVDLGDKYPQRFRIRVGRDAAAYPVGEYAIDAAGSMFVNRYGSLVLAEELVLVPLTKAKAAA